ncbi:hypothetical protein NIE88_02110 [Sporolactobacillus shoreicorticis]|uniref:VOC domain-containing protein n=1 Tax=Sporolactobacillus shoreicorticis TaxID=1923877 RepID=A0ABW5S276_9BACL|nr:hypothetical protein [Sporolactobacillus shoreicorticis]MCO7124574.1 hypothetical protein [Sporolactobacillus shoreicorticis]
MKKGAINITFGFGKKIKFDHIGFLMSDNDCQKIIDCAKKMHLNVLANERRTFVGTPYGFQIGLQTHHDAVESEDSSIKIKKSEISTVSKDLPKFFSKLFKKEIPEIVPILGEKTTLTRAVMNHITLKNELDPNGITLQTESEK